MLKFRGKQQNSHVEWYNSSQKLKKGVMFMIYIQLLEKMALIALAAYIYNQSHIFKNLIKDELRLSDKVGMVIFFSLLSIIGTYTGVNIEPHAIANTRPIGAIVAGYVGGPVIGTVVGIIAGSHRYCLGGFTAFSCAISTVCEGIIGHLARKYSKDRSLSVKSAFIGAVIAEIVQMLNLLIFARPIEDALKIFKYIAMPMIVINSIGVVLFVNIIKNAREEYNRIGAMQAQKALSIAKRTLIHLRKGLDKNTADKVASIIYEISNIKGVFIGDKKEFLTYCGEIVNEDKLKEQVLAYIKNPKLRLVKFVSKGREVYFFCAPLFIGAGEFEGVLGLRVNEEKDIDNYFAQFATGLSDLLSNQIELHKLNKIAQEASVAEFKALRAQMEPHFLFNALNTISSFCRTDPSKARELIINLSNYFRQTLKREQDFVLLKEELEFLNSYLSIEKARFGDRLEVQIDIPQEMLNVKIPVFLLQPLIENSIKHGILHKAHGGVVNVRARYVDENIEFTIEDTGVGMTEDRLKEVMSNWTGIGLMNVNERIKLLFGEENSLRIETVVNQGTKVSFFIPKEALK